MNIKILIVDDEILQLNLIGKIIRQYKPDYEVVTTHRPLEALELLRTQAFNALLTDVKMPDISGIELIRQARAMRIDPLEIIILSGFDDFQYARSAISYEVLEYLLKPIDGESLKTALKKLEEKLLEDEQQRRMQHAYSSMNRRQCAAALLRRANGLMLSQSEENAIARFGDRIRMVLAEGADTMEEWLAAMPKSVCVEPLEQRRCLVFMPAPRGSLREMIQPLPGGTVTVSLPCCREDAHQRWLELKQYADTARRLGVPVLYQQEADHALCTQFADMVCRQDAGAVLNFAPTLRLYLQSGRVTLAALAAAAQKEIARQAEEERLPHLYPQRKHELLGMLSERIALCDTPEKMCETVAEMLTETADETTSSFKKNVRIYIEAHYGEDCSLNDIARVFHYSGAHFGRLFSAEFGSTYTRWLAEYRLEKARELLQSTDLAVREIAVRVGFGDAGYLIRQFSKKYGSTPEKYRRQGS